MGKDKPKVQVILEAVFSNAIDKLMKADSGQVISALYVQLDMGIGEVLVYDDREILLEKNVIFEWAEQAAQNPRIYRQAIHFIRVSLASLRTRRVFDNPLFMLPFKITIVDDNFNEIETVFAIDGVDGFSESGRLMKNYEQELQLFYKKIFAE